MNTPEDIKTVCDGFLRVYDSEKTCIGLDPITYNTSQDAYKVWSFTKQLTVWRICWQICKGEICSSRQDRILKYIFYISMISVLSKMFNLSELLSNLRGRPLIIWGGVVQNEKKKCKGEICSSRQDRILKIWFEGSPKKKIVRENPHHAPQMINGRPLSKNQRKGS